MTTAAVEDNTWRRIRELTGDLVLVRLDVGAQVTPGGIVLPPMAQATQPHGRVVLAGPDVKLALVSARVIAPGSGGIKIQDDAEGRFVLFHEADLEAIIEDVE